jgi:hypothetical protein
MDEAFALLPDIYGTSLAACSRPYSRPMPSKGTPVRTLRSPDDVWEPAKAHAEAEGTTIGAVINAFLKRYGNRPPRQAPEEPK